MISYHNPSRLPTVVPVMHLQRYWRSQQTQRHYSQVRSHVPISFFIQHWRFYPFYLFLSRSPVRSLLEQNSSRRWPSCVTLSATPRRSTASGCDHHDRELFVHTLPPFLPPLPSTIHGPSFRRQPFFLIYRSIASWKWIILFPRAYGTVCTLLKPCPFNVRPESLFAVSAAIHIPPPSLSISASYWLTPERSALNPTPLHYFKLHLTCLAWPLFFFFFFLFFYPFSPLVLFVYYCCTMNQSGEPGRHLHETKRTHGREGQSVSTSQLGAR